MNQEEYDFVDGDNGHKGPFWRIVIPLGIFALVFIGLAAAFRGGEASWEMFIFAPLFGLLMAGLMAAFMRVYTR